MLLFTNAIDRSTNFVGPKSGEVIRYGHTSMINIQMHHYPFFPVVLEDRGGKERRGGEGELQSSDVGGGDVAENGSTHRVALRGEDMVVIIFGHTLPLTMVQLSAEMRVKGQGIS